MKKLDVTHPSDLTSNIEGMIIRGGTRGSFKDDLIPEETRFKLRFCNQKKIQEESLKIEIWNGTKTRRKRGRIFWHTDDEVCRRSSLST